MNSQRQFLQMIAVVGAVILAGFAYAEDQLVLKTKTEKESYHAGISIVKNLKQQGGEFNLDIVIQGMKDGLTSETTLLSEEDFGTTMVADSQKTEQQQIPWQRLTLANAVAPGQEQADMGPEMKIARNELSRLHGSNSGGFWSR